MKLMAVILGLEIIAAMVSGAAAAEQDDWLPGVAMFIIANLAILSIGLIVWGLT